MRISAVLIALLAVGCTTSGGDPGTMFQPQVDAVTRSSNLAADADAASDGSEQEGFRLDGYKDEQAQVDGVDTDADAAALAQELGADNVDIPADPQPGGTPDAGTPPLSPPGYPPAAGQPTPPPGAAVPPAPRWTPADAVTLSWGLRLVSTVDGATPPRAILGLPDGSEEVVKAGDLLPEARVIVLAVGQDVVQLGRVTPSGDHAQVESVFLQAMFTEPQER